MEWEEKFKIIEAIARQNFIARGETFSMEKWSLRLGCAKANVQKWKNGTSKPGFENLCAIVRDLEISPVWLLLGVGEPYEGYDKTSPEYAYICDTLKEFLPQVGQDSEVAQVGNITPHELRSIKDCIHLPSALTLARWVTAYRLNANFLLAHVGQPFLTPEQYDETFAHVENTRMIRDLSLKQELAKDLGVTCTTAQDSEVLRDALREITALTKENRRLHEQLDKMGINRPEPFNHAEPAHL